MSRRYWVETLGCPKNEVDSAKLVGTLTAEGYEPAGEPQQADLVVVNTCAFIEAARQDSIDAILALGDARKDGAHLVVTGCLAERYGAELADALPEVDKVAGFGIPVTVSSKPPKHPKGLNSPQLGDGGDSGVLGHENPFDLLNLPRPKSDAPWAYVKVAEGCDRKCGFCAIPSFRGRQRSRSRAAILAEVEALDVAEVVLVAQDLASYGRDIGRAGDIIPLVTDVGRRVPRTRLLYLYPSELSDGLIEVMGETGCHYFDLSLQHASRAHLRRMRRWGDGDRFAERIATIRRRYPDAAFRSSFIVGYPGETEEDHDALLRFLDESQLDWAGFFAYSPEAGTYAATLPDVVPAGLVTERLLECGELQDVITAARRHDLVGQTVTVLVDRPGVGRSHREAPEIDGVIHLPVADTAELVGQFTDARIVASAGPDLDAVVAAPPGRHQPPLEPLVQTRAALA
ncbi:MAG TPA: 30S ribosomal protein S12 methylthiotransferase RimO [Acidimicrobiales bacterium]|nr:30S ribosomal protein S12 methylthiotransferase RimO [Acidimicrobiales bacterium]